MPPAPTAISFWTHNTDSGLVEFRGHSSSFLVPAEAFVEFRGHSSSFPELAGPGRGLVCSRLVGLILFQGPGNQQTMEASIKNLIRSTW